MAADLRDRYRGTLLGLAVGNALGGPVEGWPPGEIRRRHPGGLRDIPAGERDLPWDDDVAQAVLLAEALLEGDGLRIDDLADRLVRWADESGRGIGILTSEVISRLAAGVPAEEAARQVWEEGGRRSAPNGAVMRCAPVALRWRADRDRLVAESLLSAEVTHADPRCGWSAAALNLCIRELLEDRPLDVEALAASVPDAPDEVREGIRAAEATDLDALGLAGRDLGYTIKALRVGMWAAVASGDVEAALVSVVSSGGDTDTNGAVAGAVLGARLGAAAIPERWLEVIPGRDRLTELADELLARSERG